MSANEIRFHHRCYLIMCREAASEGNMRLAFDLLSLAAEYRRLFAEERRWLFEVGLAL